MDYMDDLISKHFSDNGISTDIITTNCYSYRFKYNDWFVHFVNQSERIVGGLYKKNPLCDSAIMSKPETSFVFYGYNCINNLIKLILLSDEERMKMGNDVFLEEDNFDVLITPGKSITQFSSYKVHLELSLLPSIFKQIALWLSVRIKGNECNHPNLTLMRTYGGGFSSMNTWLNIYEYCDVCGYTKFKYRKV